MTVRPSPVTSELPSSDAYLCIVSKREVRRYTADPIPDDVLTRILEAGRVTGSARNRQQWQFVVVLGQRALGRLAETVAAPDNIRGCQIAIAVVLLGQSPWDGGRVAQNMMLAAWSMGVGSCPNTPTPPHRDACKAILGVPHESEITTILSMGHPDEPVPRVTDPDTLLQRIDRKPLEELVQFVS